MDVGWTSAAVAVIGAVVAVASLVVTIVEGVESGGMQSSWHTETTGGSVGRGSPSGRSQTRNATTTLQR